LKTFAVRAAVVAGAYLATALAVVSAILLLRRTISPSALREVLGFYFIAALAAGLEPATVKAALLGEGTPPGNLGAVLGASALKALAAAPVLALVWRFADPGVPLAVLLLSPLATIAGFWASDVRVLLDAAGRHASAVWLKQGSLAGGFVLLAVLIGCGTSLSWAVLVSSLPRLAAPVMAGLAIGSQRTGAPTAGRLMADMRWVEMAAVSALAAAGGSVDRMMALRWLPAGAYGGYYLLYELFSRFWLIPYLITPILFARLAAGQAGHGLQAGSWRFTIAAGAMFVAAVAAVAVAAPSLASHLLGVAVGVPAIAFAGAIVLAALTQLRMAELQASGASRRALLVTALGALTAAVAFFVGARTLGVEGLLWAWLVKSAIEFAAAMMEVRDEARS
jgi:hypothetical protein